MKAVSATKVLVEDSRTVEYRTGRPSDVHIGDDLFPLESCTPAPVSRHQELDSGVLSDVMHGQICGWSSAEIARASRPKR